MMPLTKDLIRQRLTDGMPTKAWMDMQQIAYDKRRCIKTRETGGGRKLTVAYPDLEDALLRVTKLKASGHSLIRACEITCKDAQKLMGYFIKAPALAKHWRHKNQ